MQVGHRSANRGAAVRTAWCCRCAAKVRHRRCVSRGPTKLYPPPSVRRPCEGLGSNSGQFCDSACPVSRRYRISELAGEATFESVDARLRLQWGSDNADEYFTLAFLRCTSTHHTRGIGAVSGLPHRVPGDGRWPGVSSTPGCGKEPGGWLQALCWSHHLRLLRR